MQSYTYIGFDSQYLVQGNGATIISTIVNKPIGHYLLSQKPGRCYIGLTQIRNGYYM